MDDLITIREVGRTDTFITDFGQDLVATDEEGQPAFIIGRYGVWQYSHPKAKHQVVDTGDDLTFLQEKYGPCEVLMLSQKADN